MKRSVRLVTILLLLSLTWVLSRLPAEAGDPINLIVSNIRDNSFVVSWTTAESEVGQVQLIGGATFNDERGKDFSGTTHYVTLNGLKPGAPYQFDVMSGGKKNDRGGIHYAVTTGTYLDPPIPDLIVGQVKNPDGSNANDAIVLVTLQRPQGASAPLSMLLTQRDGGVFHINLSDTRGLNDATRYLNYVQDDQLTIQAVSRLGIGMTTLLISDARLRSSDPKQMPVVELRENPAAPTIVAEPMTPTPLPEKAQPSSNGSLLIGIGIAGLIVIGILAVAATLVWKR